MTACVHSLFIYPLKSAMAVRVDEIEMTARGPAGDRLWMVVNEGGTFLTQRQNARLSQVRAMPDGRGGLFLSAVGMPDVHVDAAVTGAAGVLRKVEIWKDVCLAFDAGEAAAQWLGRYLETPCRLVGQLDTCPRPVKAEYGGQGEPVSFADDFPVLLTAEPSLLALDSHFSTPLAMDRFRPNIVTAGHDAFAEDTWRKVKIGDVDFDVTKPCARCVMTTIDQLTGQRLSNEPVETLARLRRGRKGAYFGQNILPRGLGRIRVGDRLDVVTTGPAHPELEGVRLTWSAI